MTNGDTQIKIKLSENLKKMIVLNKKAKTRRGNVWVTFYLKWVEVSEPVESHPRPISNTNLFYLTIKFIQPLLTH